MKTLHRSKTGDREKQLAKTAPITSAADLVWKTWHHVPFSNGAMTNAVVALHSDPLTNSAAELLQALKDLRAVAAPFMRNPSLDDPVRDQLPLALEIARAAIAKASVEAPDSGVPTEPMEIYGDRNDGSL